MITPDPPPFTISQVAHAAGVSVSRARMYTAMGLVRPCAFTTAGYQLFDQTGVERFRFLATATAAGLRISDLAELLRAIDHGQAGQARAARDRLRQLVEKRQRSLAYFARLLDRICAHAGMWPFNNGGSR